MRADCIKLDVSEDVLLGNADVRTRFLEKTFPIQKVRDAKILFEEPVDDSVVTAKPINFSWSDLDQLLGGEQGSNAVVQENVQLPNSDQILHSDVLSENVPEYLAYLSKSQRQCMPM